MKNPPNWRMTLLGVVLIIVAAAILVGCQETPAPAPEPEVTPPVEVVVPPVGAEEGHIGDPEATPDLTPVENGRDPDWDCTPTDNTAINDWKREAKCGGKLDGE